MRAGAFRRDRGAGMLEYTGFTVAVAAVLAAVVVMFTGWGPYLGGQLTYAYCQVFGSGNCTPPNLPPSAHLPPDPCVVNANGHDNMIQASFVVTFGSGEKWLVEQLSDGRYRITRGTSEAVGWEPGVGFNATVTVDGSSFGTQAEAGFDLEARFGAGEVYYADSQDEVNDLFDKHIRDVTEDMILGDSGPGRWLWNAGNDLIGTDNPLPKPDETYVEGGLTMTAEAGVTSWTASADAEVGVKAVLGYRKAQDGSTTEYYQAKVFAGADGSLFGPAMKLRADGAVNAAVEIERDPDGNITAVRIRSQIMGQADASASYNQGDPDASSFEEQVLELPIRNDTDEQIAQDYLRALGMVNVPGFSIPIGPVATVGNNPIEAAMAFGQAAADRGYYSRQTFNYTDTQHGAEVTGEPIVGKFGGTWEYTGMTRDATSGQYWDGAQWVDWPGCGGTAAGGS